MQRAISETNRRRGLQTAYNEQHGIEPQTIRKAVTDILASLRGREETAPVPGKDQRKRRPGEKAVRDEFRELAPQDLGRLIQTLEDEMHEASAELRFEYAARLRDEIKELKRELRQAGIAG
jgi:excinuclease ABC subunit B